LKRNNNSMSESESNARRGGRLFYGYIIIIAASFILFAAYGVRFSYGIFFNPMSAELEYSSATISAAFSISMLLEGIFSLVMGGLADRLGPRKVLTFSCILIGLGYGLMRFVHSPWQLYVFYGLFIGIGMGGIFVPLVSMTARWFSARRSLMTGIVLSGAGIGMLVMSPVSATLIQLLDWRTTFMIMGILIISVILAGAQFLKRDPSQIGALPYGEKQASGNTASSLSTGFTFKEAIHTRLFWFIFLMIFLYGFYSSAINVHIVPDAIKSGMSATTAASILSVSGASMVVGRLILGSAADRTGNKIIFSLGFALSIAALFLIVGIQTHWVFFVFAVAIGIAQGGIGTSQSPLIANLFGLKNHGLIYGLVGLAYTLGAGAGPYLMGYLFDITGSYQIALIISGCASAISLFLALLIKPVTKSSFTTARI